jgi:hypothetical protein
MDIRLLIVVRIRDRLYQIPVARRTLPPSDPERTN